MPQARAGQAHLLSLLLKSCLILATVSLPSCNNGQFSEHSSTDTDSADSPSQSADSFAQPAETSSSAITSSQLGTQGNADDSKKATTASGNLKSQACVDADSIRKVEWLVTASPVEDFAVHPLYKSNETVMSALKDARQQGKDSPRFIKKFQDGNEGFILYHTLSPEAGPLPAPTFTLTLKQQGSQTALRFPIDDSKQALFSGGQLSQKFSNEAAVRISELTSVRVEKDTIELESQDLSTSVFTQVEKSQIVLNEVNRRLLQKIKIKINNILIYDHDNIEQILAKNPPEAVNPGTKKAPTASRYWQDLNLRDNPAFQKYLQSFLSCTNK